MVPEAKKGRVALLFEVLELIGIEAAEAVDHLFAELHGRGQHLGVSAQNVSKIDVQKFSRFRDQQIVQMSVTDT